jgi:hypothetical protein
LNDSHTNRSPANEAAITSPLSGIENSEKVPENTSQPNEVTTPTAGAPVLLPPQPSKAVQIFTWIKQSIVAQTRLPEAVSSLVTFWVISTWFQEALTVLPCLVISGPAHDATLVLRVLNDFCRGPALLAGFRRSDLITLNSGRATMLISEPNLDNRAAALLGNLTNQGFMIVEERSLICCARSRAIYVGEDPAIRRIQHSIYIHITPTDAEPPTPPQWLQQNIEDVPSHLDRYREKNLDHVRRLEFSPSGVSLETAAIAKALGSCIVDAPDLQEKLVALLKAQDQQHLSQRSDTVDAVIVEAALALSRHGTEHVYAREIAAEVDRLLEARGEGMKLRPEKVGHRLRKLGLPTRRLTQAGNGLVWDKATIASLQQLAAVYVGEDLLAKTENLHCSQATEKKKVENVM